MEYIAFRATTIVAGKTNTLMLFNKSTRYIPTAPSVARFVAIAPPAVNAAIMIETEATKKALVSLSPTFKNPTTKPTRTNIGVAHGPIKPARIATSIPNIKAHTPTFTNLFDLAIF